MARSYGRFTTSITRDADFRQLTIAEQGVYFLLGLQPEVTAAGTLPLTLRRWAAMSAGMSADELSETLSVLADAGHILIDWDTEELLIVKFVKWDGGIENRNRRPVVQDAACAVSSERIRHRLALEIAKLGHPEMAAVVHPDAHADAPSDAHADRASDAHSTSDRVVVTKGELVPQPLNPSPQPATPLPVAERPAQKRGTRLDADWRPSEETRNWTLERLSSQDAATELEKFRNHWISKTGRDATKLDWDRTWRNWVLNSRASTSAQQSLPGVGRATAKAQGWLALAQDPEGRLA